MKRRRTWFTPVRVAVWLNIIQVFYDKIGLVIILEVCMMGNLSGFMEI